MAAAMSVRGQLVTSCTWSSASIALRSLSSSAVCQGMYRNKRRKIRESMQKDAELKAKYEKLDEEDRPTGCVMCPQRTDIEFNYKNVRLLSQFVSPHTGRIYGRNINGLCSRKQKELTKAVKLARNAGFMPVTMKYLEFHDDPRLY